MHTAHRCVKVRGDDCYLRAVRHRRQVDILRHLRAGGVVSVEDLARDLDVSAATIRRDLQQLDRAGVLTRVHGGAHLSGHEPGDSEPERPFAEVAASHAADKDRVGPDGGGTVARRRRAAARHRHHDHDAGPRPARPPGHRDDREPGRRATCCATTTQVELVVLGGPCDAPTSPWSACSPRTPSRRSAPTGPSSAPAASAPTGRCWTPPAVEVPVKRALIAAADQVVLLADRAQVARVRARCGSAPSRTSTCSSPTTEPTRTRSSRVRRGRRGGAHRREAGHPRRRGLPGPPRVRRAAARHQRAAGSTEVSLYDVDEAPPRRGRARAGPDGRRPPAAAGRLGDHRPRRRRSRAPTSSSRRSGSAASPGARDDERVALDLGLLGQETTGPGGLAYGLRTVPGRRPRRRAGRGARPARLGHQLHQPGRA